MYSPGVTTLWQFSNLEISQAGTWAQIARQSSRLFLSCQKTFLFQKFCEKNSNITLSHTAERKNNQWKKTEAKIHLFLARDIFLPPPKEVIVFTSVCLSVSIPVAISTRLLKKL